MKVLLEFDTNDPDEARFLEQTLNRKGLFFVSGTAIPEAQPSFQGELPVKRGRGRPKKETGNTTSAAVPITNTAIFAVTTEPEQKLMRAMVKAYLSKFTMEQYKEKLAQCGPDVKRTTDLTGQPLIDFFNGRVAELGLTEAQIQEYV